MKGPLSPCAPTSHFLQSLPKKRRTDVLEPSSGTDIGTGIGTGTTGKDVENPETRSIYFPSTSDIERSQYIVPGYYDTPGFGFTDSPGHRVDRAMHQRISRANAAEVFRSGYRYGSSPMDTEIYEVRYCISSGRTCSWKDKSSGIIWVAVHGIDSICVVTSVNGVDMTRAEDDWKCSTENEILCLFLKTVISEIEGLCADPSSKLRKRLVHLSIKKPPFSVVSIIPSTNEVDEESDQDEVDEDFVLEDSDNCSPNKALEFLEKKMKSIDSTSTTSKTIVTAIGALQQLFHTQLEACEIQGCFLKFEEMKVEFLQISELERHLEVVNAEASIN